MTSQEAGEAAARAVTFGVLGPLEARDGSGLPLALKGPRHRAVLARLLIARGRVVPVGRLVDDLWDRPPQGAVGAIQTFVSALRRALEPDRPPRRPARLLVTAAPGYALRAAPDAVDAWRFEAAVGDAGALLSEGRHGEALAGLEEARSLWRGPAYAEFPAQGWALGEIARLDGLRLLAVERRAQALLALGRAAEAVLDLEPHTVEHPLREDAWTLLALALYRSGRQGDALAVLRRARGVLAEELGTDPGPGLRALEADILAQAPHLVAAAEGGANAAARASGATRSSSAARAAHHPAAARSSAAAASRTPHVAVAARPFVGRAAELARLEEAAATAADRGPVLVLVSGEAGAGKTALAEALTDTLTGRGWRAAWGRGPEHDGAPGDWPWTQIVGALAASGTGPAPPPELLPGTAGGAPAPQRPEPIAPFGPAGPPGPPGPFGPAEPTQPTGPTQPTQPTEDRAAARFRTYRAAVAHLRAVAAGGPLLLVVDDLHRAGEETLDLLAALAADAAAPAAAAPAPILLMAIYRSTEISPALAGALARFARAEPVRVYVGGLPEAATGALVNTVLRREADPGTARTIHRRSGGNPFFVRELARLVDTEGGGALDAVPPGVRDVIRHRLARLPEPARDVLRQAAVIGPDVDVDVLIALGADEEVVLDALESALVAGFLTEQRPQRPRFAHALVRDTLYDDISGPRRARWHARVGEAVERLYPDDVLALAHHFDRARSRSTAARAARYAREAAVAAERRFAPHEAARLWRQAVAAHDRSGPGDVRDRLTAVMGLVRALAVTGDLDSARRYRAEAVATAEALGEAELTAEVISAFDVPAIWTRNDDEELAARIVRATERTLAALPADRAARRSRLLSTLALELRGAAASERGRTAAREAEVVARSLEDPALLAFALNGRFMQAFQRAGLAAERAAIGAELVELATRHHLVTFEVLGRLILVQAHGALADFAAADAHAAAADRLAERYGIPLAGVFTRWYRALRPAVAGRAAEAEAACRAASAALGGTGMPGVEQGVLPFALLCLRLQTGGRPAADDAADWGPYAPWVRPLTLLAAGRRAEGEAAARAIPDSPRDLLYEARTCLAARAALAVADRPAMERAYAGLLPAAHELAGAGSGLLTLGPVAHSLGDLAAALGRPADAAGHYRRALAVARKAGAPQWATAAAQALVRLEGEPADRGGGR